MLGPGKQGEFSTPYLDVKAKVAYVVAAAAHREFLREVRVGRLKPGKTFSVSEGAPPSAYEDEPFRDFLFSMPLPEKVSKRKRRFEGESSLKKQRGSSRTTATSTATTLTASSSSGRPKRGRVANGGGADGRKRRPGDTIREHISIRAYFRAKEAGKHGEAKKILAERIPAHYHEHVQVADKL